MRMSAPSRPCSGARVGRPGIGDKAHSHYDAMLMLRSHSHSAAPTSPLTTSSNAIARSAKVTSPFASAPGGIAPCIAARPPPPAPSECRYGRARHLRRACDQRPAQSRAAAPLNRLDQPAFWCGSRIAARAEALKKRSRIARDPRRPGAAPPTRAGPSGHHRFRTVQ